MSDHITTDTPENYDAYVKKASRKKWWMIGTVFVFIAIVAFAVWAVWFSSLFAVKEVRAVSTDGSQLTQEQMDQIVATAAIDVGQPLAVVSTDEAAQKVSSLTWVSQVEVRRGWPSEVVVAVTGRTPIAKVDVDSKVEAVDSAGVVFPHSNLRNLPEIDAEGEALLESVKVLTALPEKLRKKVTSISATSIDDVELTLRSGAVVRWGSSEEPDFKAQVLEALLNRRASIYDVSAPELPTTTNEKGPKKKKK